jgi:hypothetical protein
MPYFLIAKLVGSLLLAGVLAAGVMRVRSWHEDARRLPTVERQLEAAAAERDAHIEAARKAAETANAAEARLDTLIHKQQAVKIIYREAVNEDPECAEWAAAPVRCPLGGGVQSGGEAGTRGVPDLPGHPSVPDP